MGVGAVLGVAMVISDLVWAVGASVADATVEAGVYITFPWVGVPSVTVSTEGEEVTITWPLTFSVLNYCMLALYIIDFALLVLVMIQYNNQVGGWVALSSGLLVLACNVIVKGLVWAWLLSVWRPVAAGNSEIITGG